MLPALFNSALRQQETAIRSTLTALCNQLHSALADAAQSPPAASSTQCRRYAWSAAAAKRPRRPRVDPKLPDSIFAPQPASPLTKVEPGVLPEQLVEELQTYGKSQRTRGASVPSNQRLRAQLTQARAGL